jgi:hypothetical protein
MEREKRLTLYLVILGVLFALLLFEFTYQHPNYHVQLISTDFNLTDPFGVALGRVNSSIQVAYDSGDPSRIGEFTVVVGTSLHDPPLLTSVYSREVNYEVKFLLHSEEIAGFNDNYLGSSNLISSNTLYNTQKFPSIRYPMLGLRSRLGLLNLQIVGLYYNSTSGHVITRAEAAMDIFIMPPFIQIFTFTLIFFIICLWLSYVDCVCVNCGKKAQNLRIYRCSQFKCPRCSAYMLNENKQ